MSEGANFIQFKNQAYRVETQVPGLHDGPSRGEGAEAHRLKGIDYRSTRATIEITQDNIRDFCNYMGTSGIHGLP